MEGGREGKEGKYDRDRFANTNGTQTLCLHNYSGQKDRTDLLEV